MWWLVDGYGSGMGGGKTSERVNGDRKVGGMEGWEPNGK